MIQKIFVLLLLAASVLLIILSRNTDQPASIDPEVVMNNSQLTLNVVAHKITGEHKFATNRDNEDIVRVINGAQQIWGQADIMFDTSFVETKVSEQAIEAFANSNFNAILEEDFYRQGVINIFFINNLPANGIAIYPSAVFVNDTTTVNDYRATAHEIGHILGLQHTNSSTSRLLFQGVNGTILTKEEIESARIGAEAFLMNF